MSRVVLDASAVLALLAREPGADVLTPELLSGATTSSVNLAEVQSKLVERGMDADEAWDATVSFGTEVMSFTGEHARIAGNLVRETRSQGLSLGDRACLALGIALKLPVYTADKSWRKLKVPIPVHFIR